MPTAARSRPADKVLPVPAQTVVITCNARRPRVCPGDSPALPPPGATYYYLFKHGPYPNDQYGPFPNMTGKDLKLSGHAGRTSTRPRASRS